MTKHELIDLTNETSEEIDMISEESPAVVVPLAPPLASASQPNSASVTNRRGKGKRKQQAPRRREVPAFTPPPSSTSVSTSDSSTPHSATPDSASLKRKQADKGKGRMPVKARKSTLVSKHGWVFAPNTTEWQIVKGQIQKSLLKGVSQERIIRGAENTLLDGEKGLDGGMVKEILRECIVEQRGGRGGAYGSLASQAQAQAQWANPEAGPSTLPGPGGELEPMPPADIPLIPLGPQGLPPVQQWTKKMLTEWCQVRRVEGYSKMQRGRIDEFRGFVQSLMLKDSNHRMVRDADHLRQIRRDAHDFANSPGAQDMFWDRAVHLEASADPSSSDSGAFDDAFFEPDEVMKWSKDHLNAFFKANGISEKDFRQWQYDDGPEDDLTARRTYANELLDEMIAADEADADSGQEEMPEIRRPTDEWMKMENTLEELKTQNKLRTQARYQALPIVPPMQIPTTEGLEKKFAAGRAENLKIRAPKYQQYADPQARRRELIQQELEEAERKRKGREEREKKRKKKSPSGSQG